MKYCNIQLCTFLFVSLLSVTDLRVHCSSLKLSPTILIPGDGGSQLWVKLNESKRTHSFCQKQSSSYFLLWLDVKLLVYPFCFVDNMILKFDNNTKAVYSPEGVDVKVMDFGNTSGVEYLSNVVHLRPTTYFKYIVDGLVSLKYSRGVSIRGAPFDFRRAPTESLSYFMELKKLIEDTYIQNDNHSVTLLAHSLGCLYSHTFLLQQTQAWKDQYIQAFISISGPYAGAVMSIVAELFGDNENIIFVKPKWVRPAQQSWPSTAYLMPTLAAWDANETIVMTSSRNYTVNDYRELFQDGKYAIGFDIYQYISSQRLDPHLPPGVRTFCLWSQGKNTPDLIDWRQTEFPDAQPRIIYGDGDGTVNLRSLKICSGWQSKQSQKVDTKIFQGYEHLDIIRAPEVVSYINEIMENSS